MKKCPQCDLNYIKDDQEMCSVCALANKTQVKNSGGMVTDKKTKLENDYGEYFTVVNEKDYVHGKNGYKAFNSKGECVGIAYMTDREEIVAYGHVELCFLKEFYDRYGQWHRVRSYGQRIAWEKLVSEVEGKGQFRFYVD